MDKNQVSEQEKADMKKFVDDRKKEHQNNKKEKRPVKSLSSVLNDKMPDTVSRIVEEEFGLYCEGCGQYYDYHRFASGYEYKDGCQCEFNELYRQKIQKDRIRVKGRRLKRMFKYSHISEEIKDATFEQYEPNNEIQIRAKRACERYAINFDKENKQSLVLTGPYGVGKSHLAMAVVNYLVEKDYTALFMNVEGIVTMFRETYNDKSKYTASEIHNEIRRVDLMVIDDYGVELTDYGRTQLFQVMENRVGKHNIITSNLRLEQMTNNKADARIFSRITKNCTAFEITGEDQRGKNLRVIR
ncbi:ATP-binding protein [Staphylococcus xylosus]|uniref:ATP-binding protein n=1 Tax=Staphylococcus xylosus TaxID=1288 RepID=UPI0013048C28|nr:ATP-binding protein [Staphylococcus xylosus]